MHQSSSSTSDRYDSPRVDNQNAVATVDVVQFLAVHDDVVFDNRDLVIRRLIGPGLMADEGTCVTLPERQHTALNHADGTVLVGDFLCPAGFAAHQSFARQFGSYRRYGFVRER